MSQVKRASLSAYGFAVLVVALATASTWALPLLGERIPFALFYAAVMLGTWYGGRWPGIFATALSAVASAYFFLHPQYSLDIGFQNALLLLVFLAVSLVINYLMEKTRRAGMMARAAREQMLTTLVSIGDAVMTTDGEGRVEFMNPVAQALTGWALDAARGRPLREVFNIVNEETREQVESPVEKVLAAGAVVGLANHTVLLARDGRETPIDDSGAPIRGEDGRIAGVVLVFRDITERRQSEEVRLRLGSIVESSDDAIIGKTLEGVITNWNKGAERLYGYTAGEVVGRPISILVTPDRPREIDDLLALLKRGERIEHFETTRVRKDGEVIDVALTISPIRNAEGVLIGASTIARNITDRRRRASALRESEERYRAFVRNSSEAIWRFELEEPVAVSLPVDEQIELFYRHGYLAECNDAMAEMYGFTSAADIVGAKFDELLVRDDPRNVEFLRAFVKSGYRMTEAESHEVDREGRPKYFLNNLVGIIEDGKLLRAWGTQRDITERQLAEEERAALLLREQAARREAEDANRLKDEFLATLSHELRTPLTAILGWTKMLRMMDLDEATAAHALETVERNAKAQAQLVEDLLDVSRIITGKLRLDARPTELVPVVKAAMDAVRPAAAAKSIELVTALDPLAGPVSGDPARLQQVAWNLISNAVKFTGRGGHVDVRLERVDAHVEFTVSDTGQGIAPEFLPYVFDRFRQADGSTTRLHGGLGLGLAIVRHLVELHGGTVRAESAGAGHGATFKVQLPVTALRGADFGLRVDEQTDEQSATSNPHSSILSGVRVLVVDDEEDARALLRTVLEKYGAEVVAAASTREALAAVERDAPDVLISDIGMPEEDGYELIRRVRALDPERGGRVPAAAVSAYAGEDNRREAVEAGFQLHVAKPVDPEELIKVVRDLARSSRQ
ncbi:MAG TPA: PAS domain S-box protein [Pyrinomonadaceae bacterium]|nr:PAS domain S-box protein [Pyrinomonadaceae bacterium]